MKFSENWLRERINAPADITEWAEKLTAAGLEVEALITLGVDLKNITIGHVLSTTPHPNADRLNVCQVRLHANAEPLTIVCGASNVRAGLKVAVAEVGAVLPGDLRIKQSKIRGVESCGMICSSTELGLGESAAGIMELAEDAPLGTAFSEYLGLPDHVLDIGLTPNRGDCLSMAGLSRELGVVTGWPMVSVKPQKITPTIDDVLSVEVQTPTECPRYIGRIIKGIQTDAVTPVWMQERLRRSGVRIIHPVVDVMNYVMLELGQPLHAFDLSAIKKQIVVRQSNPGESISLLDGQTITLAKPALVIADSEKALALAGIMGGADSGVTATTTDIFIESAFFAPDGIRPTLRVLHLQSDAAHRFERGVDFDLPLCAIHRATELVLSISGGQVGPITDATHTEHLPLRKKILLRANRIERILGIQLSEEEIEKLLRRLNFDVAPNPQGWEVTVPSYRFDLGIEIDLIEEIARVHGYTHIPSQTLKAALVMQPISETQLTLSRLRSYFVDKGYHETINYSFVDPKLAKLFCPAHEALALSNPISENLSVMRTSLWPGLIQSALFNLNRQQSGVRFFETGICFFPAEKEVKHVSRIAGIAIGTASLVQWGLSEKNIDFFDVKGDLEGLFAFAKDSTFDFVSGDHPALHPGRCAKIQRADKSIGYVGELHPELKQLLDIPLPVYLFELDLESILSATLPVYSSPSKYPSIRRDLAFVVQDVISYEHIKTAVRNFAGEALQDLQLFDIYKGTGITLGQKSLALSLTFQLTSRTLTDEDVDVAVQKIIAGLGKDFEATLRE
jgi:phenylalanyl-tRNA synthetase beta chain